MKAIKILGHPIVFISLFLLLIIEGDQFGGLYLLYLVLSLPQGASYAVLSFLGIASVFAGYKLNYKNESVVKPLFLIAGFVLMFFSLALFFSKDNKWETFHLTIPLLSFIIFFLSSMAFLSNVVMTFLSRSKKNTGTLTMV